MATKRSPRRARKSEQLPDHPRLSSVGDLPVTWNAVQDGLELGETEKIAVEDLHRLVVAGPNQQTVAVTGEWGSGKTSLMRMVKGRIDDEKRFPTAWFNAWRYEQDEFLALPLVATIEHELTRAGWFQSDGRKGAKERFRRISLALARATSIGYGPLKFSGKEAVDSFFESTDGGPSDAGLYFGFTVEMENLIAELGADVEDFRLVVFVDDLDRCLDEGMFRTMEQLKLFFDIPGIVFVVGVSVSALRDAVVAHYSDAGDPKDQEAKADLYVEKIFQQRRTVVPVSRSSLMRSYGQATGCPLWLDDQAASPLVPPQDPISFPDLARSLLGAFGLRKPREVKLWIDAIDAYVHRYLRVAPMDARDARFPVFWLGPLLEGRESGRALRTEMVSEWWENRQIRSLGGLFRAGEMLKELETSAVLLPMILAFESFAVPSRLDLKIIQRPDRVEVEVDSVSIRPS